MDVLGTGATAVFVPLGARCTSGVFAETSSVDVAFCDFAAAGSFDLLGGMIPSFVRYSVN